MSAAYSNLIIDYNNGNPGFNPPAGVTILKNRLDSVRLNLTGFTGGDELNKGIISQIDIYNNQVGQDGDDEKGELEGSWEQDTDKNSSLAYHIGYAHNRDNSLTYYFISYFEPTPAQDDKYWFGVTISSTEGKFSVDPELVNKAGD